MERPNSQQTRRCHLMCPLKHTNTQRQSAQQRFATPLRFPAAHLVHPWYPFGTPVVPIWYTRGTHVVLPWYLYNPARAALYKQYTRTRNCSTRSNPRPFRHRRLKSAHLDLIIYGPGVFQHSAARERTKKQNYITALRGLCGKGREAPCDT